MTSEEVIKKLKAEAKDFRARYKISYGGDISHGRALEHISHIRGFKNWNVLIAIAKKDPYRITFT